jgi:hypothetical protein
MARWNEWITLPIRYCDLPLSSQITFTVWDIGGPREAIPVGGSTFRLFGKKWFVMISEIPVEEKTYLGGLLRC